MALMTSVAPMTSVATVAIVRRNQTTTVVSFNQIRKIQLSRVGLSFVMDEVACASDLLSPRPDATKLANRNSK